MNGNGLLSDPAIIGLSSPAEGSGEEQNPKTSKLEPGSALSKLLDSAMANAAKEATPESESGPELKSDGQQQSRSNRSSIQDFWPTERKDFSRVYSINYLLDLRSSPAVLEFDAARLPDYSFWRSKQKGSEGGKNNNQDHNGNNHGNSSLSGTGKRNRRNKDLANTGSSDTLNWGRKPAGFLKDSDIDRMSKEKISQLLGEPHEEETPDWDLPSSNAEMEMSMGSTVEDFERWKLHMRQEDRRRHGGPEIVEEIAEAAPSNEVDSFFSFVRPGEAVAKSPSSSGKKQPENKSSRFSSFFGGAVPAANCRSQSTDESENSTSGRQSLKEDFSGGSLRFFHGDFKGQTASHPQSPQESQKHPERHSLGPPPGIHPKFQTYNAASPQAAMATVNGMVNHLNPPPGFHMNPGPPQGPGMIMVPGPRGPANNDSFFHSLLSKSEIGPGADGSVPMSSFPPQTAPPVEGKRATSFANNVGARGDVSFPGPGAPNSQQAKPPQYLQYQDAARGMGQQAMGMKPPPGIKPPPASQMPQGMFPPGMFPPGAQGPMGQRPHPSHQNLSLSNQQNAMHQSDQRVKLPMQGEVPPPWMRFGPNGPEGMVPPGFTPLPHGFPPGFPHAAPLGNHQQGRPQSQPKQS